MCFIRISCNRSDVNAVAAGSPAAKPAARAPSGFDLAKRFGCTACHALDTRLVRPAFREIAAKYGRDGARAGRADAEARLTTKVQSGGSGVWDEVAMPGQPQVGAADARAIVEWILAGGR